MSEDFEREERAFAEALHASVPVESFRPLDAEAIKAAARPARPARTRWLRTMAAAAVLVVTVGVGAALLPRMGGSVDAPSRASAATRAGGSVPETAQDRASGAAAPDEVKASSLRASGAASRGRHSRPARTPVGPGWAGGTIVVGGQLDQPCPPNASCLAPSRLLRDGASYDPGTGTWQAIADAPVSVSGAAVAVGVTTVLHRLGGRLALGVRLRHLRRHLDASPQPIGRRRRRSSPRVTASSASPTATSRAEAVDEVYDTGTRTWSRLPDDPLGRSFNRGAVWVDGKLLLLAHRLVANPGSEEPSLVRLAEFDFATTTWRRLPDSEVLGGGAVAVAGLVVFPDTGSARRG